MTGRKPDWLRVRVGGDREYGHVKQVLAEHNLHTVCEEAMCPNKGECWGSGTATFMILGDVCTRNCLFCAVKSDTRGAPLNRDEPENLAEAVRELNLKYVVITSVDRDDLPDRGAGHYADCIRAVKETKAKVEVLIPDYIGGELKTVIEAGPDVAAHNIEVVGRLQRLRDRRASYERSLKTLSEAEGLSRGVKTKSSIMLGLGESEVEVLEAMADLRGVGCDILVLGQYLQPTRRQTPIIEYITPDKFRWYGEAAKEKGFKHVLSEPLARTSYRAAETFQVT
jgi:lipoic acid synthetase